MKVKLSNVRLSFPQLFVAKEFKTGDGKPRYDATFLIVPGSANDKAIRDAIEAEGLAKLDKKWASFKASNERNANKWAYLDGNAKEYDGYADHWYLACHSKVPPGIYTHRVHNGKVCTITQSGGVFQPDAFGKMQPVEVDFQPVVPYAGCYVNATVDVYLQTGENPGLRGGFTGVQFFADGDAFSAGGAASPDEFADVGAGADAADLG